MSRSRMVRHGCMRSRGDHSRTEPVSAGRLLTLVGSRSCCSGRTHLSARFSTGAITEIVRRRSVGEVLRPLAPGRVRHRRCGRRRRGAHDHAPDPASVERDGSQVHPRRRVVRQQPVRRSWSLIAGWVAVGTPPACRLRVKKVGRTDGSTVFNFDFALPCRLSPPCRLAPLR